MRRCRAGAAVSPATIGGRLPAESALGGAEDTERAADRLLGDAAGQ